ncbi:tetratricopeptide repeat protein [Cyanobium sp. WAJ14-Wanaka]|uniref:O-linked N-acetylglucosamine transferase, SPINDLY family protein n=1 Tax=Cyanobium sp. WAJ14-Wanaka TaxID=2823725 RepID=UPI0020CC89C8|nr:tetratricopeptide repeat protein [Cyanobium sp. WAJ14-Wanaka]MCP9775646.1 tetratricopeptide repeat protein [Cyanobium sp. WAJ14-Wanaka]
MSSNPAKVREEAWRAHSQGDMATAEQHYRVLLEQHAEVDEAVNLGALLRQAGRISEASAHYHHWLGLFPGHQGLALNAVNCWLESKEFAAAQALLEPLIQQNPGEPALRQAMAQTLLAAGHPQLAADLLRVLVREQPDRCEAWINLGICQARLGHLGEALAAFEQAHALDPSDARMAANRITVLKDLGKLKEAGQLWSELPSEQQNQADVRGAMAGLWMAQANFEQASQQLAQLAKEQPQQAIHWLNWAACLRGLKFSLAPHQILQRGLQWQPENSELQQALGQSLAELGQLAATRRLWGLWPLQEDQLKDGQLFSRQFLGASYDLIQATARAGQARQWEDRLKKKGIGRLWPDLLLEPIEGRRLRVGYLSSDFCNHPVGRFLLPVLQNHRQEEVELWALSCGPHQDWISEHLRHSVEHWLDLRFLNDGQAARLVADQRLDVLVELGGFTGHSRLGLLAQRPAPVQLSYLGYPAPTYLREVDGWLGDSILFGGLGPTDSEAHRLLEIPGGYMAFDPGGELPLPERCDSPKFRFGCFNHARKLTAPTIELFCAVMAAVPQAELVIKSISFHEEAERDRIRRRFEAAGLVPERLRLLPWVEGGLNHLLRYSEMDVALDPIPYGGATTTAEALWMGVPVVALAGAGMVERLAASLLVHGNQPQWLAHSEAEYLQIAQELAAAGLRQRKQRMDLRLELQASPLADGARLASQLEQLYRQMRQEVIGL